MIFSLIGNFLVCISDLFKEILLFKYIFSYNFQFTKKKVVIAFLTITCVIGLSSILSATKYISIIYLPLIYGTLLLFLKEKEKRSVVYFFISYISVCQIDTLISTLIKLAFSLTEEVNIIRLLTAILSTGIIYILCMICGYFHINMVNRRLNIFIMVQVISLCLVVLLIGVVSNVVGINTDIFYGRMLIIVTCVLSIMISLLGILVYSLIQSNKNYHELEMMNKRYLEMQSKYYENVQRQNREIKKYRHDMQSHFICLNHFVMQHDVDKAIEYIKEMNYDLDRTRMEYDVGNEVASVILNDKKADLEKYSIEMIVDGKLPINILISDYDFCSIFSNLINNAVEACQRVDRNRMINIELSSYNKFISIRISNSCNNSFAGLKTSKEDVVNHGYGISKIQECVTRYGGDMKIERQEGKFIVDIIIKCN